jgi:hypothetical protein
MVDVTFHFFLSLAVGFLLWKAFDGKRRRTLILSLCFALLSGLFIDVDHLFDYYVVYGFAWNFQRFMSTDYFDKSGKNYVFFHGFEYVFILGIIAFFLKNKEKKLFFTVLATSMFVHLFTDILLFSIPVKNYFIIYRILTGFNTDGGGLL